MFIDCPRTMCLAMMESFRKITINFLLLVAMPSVKTFFDSVRVLSLTNPVNKCFSSLEASGEILYFELVYFQWAVLCVIAGVILLSSSFDLPTNSLLVLFCCA